MILLFLVCLGTVLYVYIGYPLVLASGLLGAKKALLRFQVQPKVSIIVPAHNEEADIRGKIESLLALDFPKHRIEILVGSDGSTDRTEEIVREYAPAGVLLVSSALQVGKSAIQNALVERSKGDVLIFTDADCRPSPDAVRLLVENFADPTVGLVTVRPVYSNTDENQVSENEGLYWRYENWIRKHESDRGFLAAASGWFFGVRRGLWEQLDANVGDDFVLPLRVVQRGLRSVVDDRIRVRMRLSQVCPSSMFAMKKRIVSKDLRGLLSNCRVLDPFVTGRIAIGLWSHKLLRWAVPYFLGGMLFSSAMLSGKPIFLTCLCLQVAFYGTAGFAYFLGISSVRLPWSIPLSFCIVNGAALAGTLHFVTGKKVGRWIPARR